MIAASRSLLARALVVWLTPAHAHAQDRAVAEAAFEQGRQLAAAGEFAAACAKFEESERKDPAVGTLLNLAECYERTGRTASEWAALREAAARAELAGQQQRAEAARARAAAVDAALSRLQIIVPEHDLPPGVEIRRDEVIVGPALWATPLPVDAGSHVLTAFARGRVIWTQSIDVPKGPSLVVVVCPSWDSSDSRGAVDASAVPSLAAQSSLSTAVAGAPRRANAASGVSSTSERTARETLSPTYEAQAPARMAVSRSLDARRNVGLVLLGVGAGGLASAGIAGVGAILAAQSHEIERARGWADAFDWIAIPGALASAAGVALVLTGKASARTRSGSSMPLPVAARIGLSGISGTFW